MDIFGSGPIPAKAERPNPFRQTARTSVFGAQLQALQEQVQTRSASPQQARSTASATRGTTPSGHIVPALPQTRADGTAIQWREANDADVAAVNIKPGSGYQAWIDEKNNLAVFGGEMSDDWRAARNAKKAERQRAADLATLDAFRDFARMSGQSLAAYVEAQAKPAFHAASASFGRAEGHEQPAALTRDQANALLALAKEQKLI